MAATLSLSILLGLSIILNGFLAYRVELALRSAQKEVADLGIRAAQLCQSKSLEEYSTAVEREKEVDFRVTALQETIAQHEEEPEPARRRSYTLSTGREIDLSEWEQFG